MNVCVNNSHMASRSDAIFYLASQFGLRATLEFMRNNKGEFVPVAPLSYRATKASKESFYRIVAIERARLSKRYFF